LVGGYEPNSSFQQTKPLVTPLAGPGPRQPTSQLKPTLEGFMGILKIVLVFAGLLTVYVFIIRPWQLRWGATDLEVACTMPGDEFVENPTFSATRAVTINAPPEKIWPWLIQIGYKRAGWYSYDWIDNLGKPSADCLIPELQNLKEGDFIPMGPVESLGFNVHTIVPNQFMLWGEPGGMSWLWYLNRIEQNKTRLITRVRLKYDWTHPVIIGYLFIDVGDIVMMRKCMLGIKARAEKLATCKAKLEFLPREQNMTCRKI